MTDAIENEFGDMEIAVEFHPADAETARLVKQTFADEEVLESNAFTGAEILTVVISVAKGTIGKVLDFFVKHRESFKEATVKIGPKEVSLTGYSKKEVEELISSGGIEKILREMRKKG